MILISDRYIGKQVLLGTIFAVVVLSMVLMLGKMYQEIQPLLVDQKAPLSLLARFILSVLPASLMYTLPWGFLSAVLLVFGRMSSHNEITCFRVSGMSLTRLAAPVFIVGALLSSICLWLNVDFVPRAKASTKELLYEQATRDPNSLLKPGVAHGNFTTNAGGQQKLLVEGRDGDWVRGFHFYEIGGEAEDTLYVHASEAALSVDQGSNQLRIKLENAYFETTKPNGASSMVFAERAEPLLIELEKRRSSTKKVSGMTNGEIREILNDGTRSLDEARLMELKTTLIKRYSFSMACLAFAFIAVPLGLTTRRTDTSRGLIISLAIGAGYFMISVMAEQIKGFHAASVMLWLPNIACIALGVWLFRKARFK